MGRPLFSIGAVGRMLELAPATIRTWEARYGQVVPERSAGGQRLYSREQVDQLRFIRDEVTGGRRPGEAHRLLAERVAVDGFPARSTPHRVLLAESRFGAAEMIRRLLGGEGFEIVLATDAATASRKCDEFEPDLVVIDTADDAFAALSTRLRDAGTKVLPVALLERPLALLDRGRAPVRD
jgi:DNA-binding transcriptional MerR regulator